MLYSNLYETFISRRVLHQHWYTCTIALPVYRNPRHRSLLTVVSATSAPGSGIICGFRTQLWTALRDRHFTVNRKHVLWISFALSPFAHRKTHNRTLLFGSILLKHDRHFDYWNQPLNMRVPVCHLDCHEAGLCCYLVIHIGNPLQPLQLFYFHLCPIYRLSLVVLRSRMVDLYIHSPIRLHGVMLN
jgi:hypothetical protein